MKQILRRILIPAPRIRANFAAPRLISFLLNQLSTGATILNLGCGRGLSDLDIDPLLLRKHDWINLDLFPIEAVTCVGDAHHLPFISNSVDLIVNKALLEHVRGPGQVITEMRRVLKPGAWFYCEVPFLQPYHLSPTDYQRYTLDGLRMLFESFEEVETGIVAGPGNAIRKLLVGYVSLFLNHKFARWITDWISFPVEALDALVVRNQRAHQYASALYFCGRKRLE